MRKGIKKQFWFSPELDKEFRRKAEIAGLSQSALIRMLVKGYEPKPRVNMTEFFNSMNKLFDMVNATRALLAKANRLGIMSREEVDNEIEKWESFEQEIMREFLRPEKSKIKCK